MKIFFTPDHTKHNPEAELHRGALVPPHEGPHRMDILQIGLKRAGFTDFATPPGADLSAITAVHRPDYIDFLQTAWARWQDAGYSGDVLPMSYPYTTRRKVPPKDIDGAAGYYCSSSDTPITRTTWQAAKSVAECALAASAYTSRTGQPSFTLTRPPGHHAGIAYMAGYCFLNNAAIAAQNLRKLGAKKVAILDVDFHHGNGTQDIFYARDDVLFVSLHGEPDHHFPYFWGHADETGSGKGEGFNLNLPLPAGTLYKAWHHALRIGINRIQKFGADALVVSLGVDTFEHDPISSFKLTTSDYARYGAEIAKLGVPTILIMEGGYGVPEVGDNTAGVLKGFIGAYS